MDQYIDLLPAHALRAHLRIAFKVTYESEAYHMFMCIDVHGKLTFAERKIIIEKR